MNASRTPKIIIGAGLVAIYGTALSIYALRGFSEQSPPQQQAAAVSAVASAEQAVPETTPLAPTLESLPVAESAAAPQPPPAPAVASAQNSSGEGRARTGRTQHPNPANEPPDEVASPAPASADVLPTPTETPSDGVADASEFPASTSTQEGFVAQTIEP